MFTPAENTIISLLTEIRDLLRDGQAAPAAAAVPKALMPAKKSRRDELKEYARKNLLQHLPGIAPYLPPIAPL